MSDNPEYQGTTHTDDVIEAIKRGVWGQVVRKLGAWQERLTYLQTRYIDHLPTRSEADEVNHILMELELPVPHPPKEQRTRIDESITACLNEIHYVLTGHRKSEEGKS